MARKATRHNLDKIMMSRRLVVCIFSASVCVCLCAVCYYYFGVRPIVFCSKQRRNALLLLLFFFKGCGSDFLPSSPKHSWYGLEETKIFNVSFLLNNR